MLIEDSQLSTSARESDTKINCYLSLLNLSFWFVTEIESIQVFPLIPMFKLQSLMMNLLQFHWIVRAPSTGSIILIHCFTRLLPNCRWSVPTNRILQQVEEKVRRLWSSPAQATNWCTLPNVKVVGSSVNLCCVAAYSTQVRLTRVKCVIQIQRSRALYTLVVCPELHTNEFVRITSAWTLCCLRVGQSILMRTLTVWFVWHFDRLSDCRH